MHDALCEVLSGLTASTELTPARCGFSILRTPFLDWCPFLASRKSSLSTQHFFWTPRLLISFCKAERFSCWMWDDSIDTVEWRCVDSCTQVTQFTLKSSTALNDYASSSDQRFSRILVTNIGTFCQYHGHRPSTCREEECLSQRHTVLRTLEANPKL
jgi:hypothetical protein